jgi:hypothetical protein
MQEIAGRNAIDVRQPAIGIRIPALPPAKAAGSSHTSVGCVTMPPPPQD